MPTIPNNRIPYLSGGNHTSSANLTYDGTTLTLASASTISGVMTFTANPVMSGAGRAITFNNVDGQIRMGNAADPGWTRPALQLGDEITIFSQSSTAGYLGYNLYFDGTQRRITAAVSTWIAFESNPAIRFLTAVTGAAGGAVTEVEQMAIGATGVVVGAPTGGAKGSGTLNANAVYDDNVLLTDWLFDLYYDERAKAGDKFYRGQNLYSLKEVEATTRSERRLPWMPTRAAFEDERALGKLVTNLWRGQEQQQIYIFELERRISELEAHSR